MKTCCIVVLLLAFKLSSAQTITTYGGTGVSMYIGDGVPATAAGIPNPRGGAVDKYGGVYFTDGTSSHRVRKIDAAGIISTVAGNGFGGYSLDGIAATASRLYYPASIIFDTSGNYYIADVQNFRVRKVNILTGIITTIVGTGTSGFGGDGGGGNCCNDNRTS